MKKQDLIDGILHCRGYDGIKNEKILMKLPKPEIKEIYLNALDWNQDNL